MDLFVGTINDNDDYHPVLKFDNKYGRIHKISVLNFEYVKDEIQRYVTEDIFVLEVECTIDYLRVKVIPELIEFTVSHIKMYRYSNEGSDISWYLWSIGF